MPPRCAATSVHAPLTLVLFLALSSCRTDRGAAPPRSAAPGPRNLLLLTLDTTRADRIGCYGGPAGITPHLDGLAARGARFESAIAPMALTRPSHATILTGRLPHHHGVWSNGPYRLDDSVPTLATRLGASGFSTAAVVSSFVLSRSFGLAQGFERFDDRTPETTEGGPEKNADEVVAQARAWSGELREPFCLWLHFFDPHDPYRPPEPYASRFAGRPYEGEIARMDAAIGEVLSLLEARGSLGSTLVVAAGDHGEGLGEHGEGTHGYYLYDSTVRVPLIVAGPGVAPGRVVPETVTLADLMPTLLEAFGQGPAPDGLDGASLWGGLTGGKYTEHPAVLETRTLQHQFGWAPQSGIRVERWKWILSPEPELYDLRNDPGETRNLAPKEPSRAAALEKERARLIGAVEEVKVSRLSPEDEERLASLGYIAAGPSTAGAAVDGPDPKRFAPILGDIERLLRLRSHGDPAELGPLADAILTRDAANLYARRVKGEVLVTQRRYREALAVLEPVAGVEETHPETFADLATAAAGVGRLDDSLRWLERATTPPWIHWPAVESLARFSRQHPEVLPPDRVLPRVRGLQPVSPREHISVARALGMLGATAEARSAFERALAIEPRATEARVGLAQMQLAQGRRDDALRTLAEVQPPTVESIFVTGNALASAGRRPEACAAFARARQMPAHNANLLFGLGQSLSACGDSAAAARALEAALRSDPQHAEALLALANLEDQRGATARARELYRRFLAGAPPRMTQQREAARARLAQLGSR